MGNQLPVNARLVWANNQWRWTNSPLINVSLYIGRVERRAFDLNALIYLNFKFYKRREIE
ncbi:hypothetical protein DN389_02370 [Bacillus sp. AY3-1]|nr:hypothetical protein DN389_02370 [Bacillus sp. AY3-1]